MRGPVGKLADTAVKAGGAGVLSNVIDKELFGSRLKNIKVALPAQLTSMLGPTVVTANLTDAGMLLIANGLKMPTGKSAMIMAGLWLGKKLAEARGWIIDDEIGNNYSSSNRELPQEAPPIPMISSGGLSHT